ncbi:metalloregulator ArsR/SmtB family transcription factor [Psychrobacillus lasiicapitis]|uniref:Metalloregulator ArsR/SmtB family transcription factor n=2 Tax=Psychrobacillus lasiicapitis TaxID=1636719 RepID=A0A544TH26_9BACI|nr:metalloregulator ArsR/SmtB family transcription factor [Psychrobacillus lasiicapitis]GGA27414.1 hypothetical protein GCM10011384_15930 [Psychrobacillus lasiicapitis]
MDEKSQSRDVYEAVADPTRRKILQMLANVEELPLYEITTHFEMGRTAVSKHLAILKDANLVIARKVGRETRYRLNAAPLREIQDWVSFYEGFWKERMVKLNLLLEEQNMKPDVSLDFQFTSSIEQVWNALTDSDTLAKWIWKNDFKPVVGHKFQFRAEPNEWWDGIVNSEVLVVDEPNLLSYTWESAGESTTVTWTLTKNSDGTTHLHFDQAGFSEETKARHGAIEGAKYSWMQMGEKLEKVLTEQ